MEEEKITTETEEHSVKSGFFFDTLADVAPDKATEAKTRKRRIPDNKEIQQQQKYLLIFVIAVIFSIALFSSSIVYLFRHSVNLTNNKDLKDTVYADAMSYKIKSPFGDTLKTKQVTYPDGILNKFKALYAQNSDFAGWLTVPNTGIDMPVYQTTNNSYYLRHDPYGVYIKYGCAFLDCDCLEKLGSRNTVIYAHNFGNDMFFDELHNYLDVEFYKENPVIEFSTPFKDYKWKVVACFLSNGDSTGDNGYLFNFAAPEMSDDCLMEFSDEIRQRSFIITNETIEPKDRLLTLVTCTYYFDKNGSLEDARLALVARLVREGESETVDTSKATKNDNIRMPQLYYDVFGGKNPYKNASKWKAY